MNLNKSRAYKKMYEDDPTLRLRTTRAIRAINEERKGKTLEEIYGEEKAAQIRAKLALRPRPTEEQRKAAGLRRLGTTHSEKSKRQMGETMRRSYLEGRIDPPKARATFDPELGHLTRSSYERALARELKKFELTYRYEPKRFKVIVDGKECAFILDFNVGDTWFEVKNSYNVSCEPFVSKLASFKQLYPEVDLRVVIGDRWAKEPKVLKQLVSTFKLEVT